MRKIEWLAEQFNKSVRSWWFDEESRGITKLLLFTLQMFSIVVLGSIVSCVLLSYMGIIWLLYSKEEYMEKTAFTRQPL